MMTSLKVLIQRILFEKMPVAMFVSILFFIVACNLDFTATQLIAQSDSITVGKAFTNIWWDAADNLRFFEIPLWMIAVLVTANIILLYSPFLSILWINFIAFQHLIGFLTWMQYDVFSFFYLFPASDIGYVIALISIVFSLPLTLTLRAFLPR